MKDIKFERWAFIQEITPEDIAQAIEGSEALCQAIRNNDFLTGRVSLALIPLSTMKAAMDDKSVALIPHGQRRLIEVVRVVLKGADILFLDSPADDAEIKRGIVASKGKPHFVVLSPGGARATPTQKEAAALGFKIGTFPTGMLSPAIAGMKAAKARGDVAVNLPAFPQSVSQFSKSSAVWQASATMKKQVRCAAMSCCAVRPANGALPVSSSYARQPKA